MIIMIIFMIILIIVMAIMDDFLVSLDDFWLTCNGQSLRQTSELLKPAIRRQKPGYLVTMSKLAC